jgi:hypothetical protein
VGAVRTCLLLEQVGAHVQESWRRVHHGAEDADGVAELGVEPAECVDDEFLISDGVADILECVGQFLELAAIIGNTELTLVQAVEVLQRVYGTLHGIVEEQATDRHPEGVRRCAALEHHVTNVLGHGEVDPRDDAVIDLGPLGIVDASLGVDRAVNVIEDAELAERQLEEGTPGGVVRVFQIQSGI